MAKRKTKRTTNPEHPRLPVLKTYKMFVGGKFPRTESGRHYTPRVKGRGLGNFCLASRKDLRNAVVAARAAQASWAERSAYNRSQILYRIAEMLEGRRGQLIDELEIQGATEGQAASEVDQSIERVVYYAGWCDKYQQVFSSVNPVASPHFNFSVLEPTGVVFHVASENRPLLGLLSLVLPILAGGNTVVCLASSTRPISAITLSECLATSDVPAGVVNVLTGQLAELSAHFAGHREINAIALDRPPRSKNSIAQSIRETAADSLKRVHVYNLNWARGENQNPYLIRDFCEVKTVWHPVEQISSSGPGY
ncbi:MAG: aldehyde dehydrogenase family protein [Mariniblastus sp.]|nr:aldehyde dehydrogenase family protein [Mariniblastus sp.]